MNALRWVLILPAAIMVVLFIGVVNNIDDSLPEKVQDILYYLLSAFKGFAFVGIGTSVAPKFNKIVSVILVAIVIAFSVWFMVITEFIYIIVISQALMVVGAVIGSLYVFLSQEFD